MSHRCAVLVPTRGNTGLELADASKGVTAAKFGIFETEAENKAGNMFDMSLREVPRKHAQT